MEGIEVKKLLILTLLLFACATSTGRAWSNNPGVFAASYSYYYVYYPYYSYYPYWSEWGYWGYQYPNVFQPSGGIFPDTRKNLLQGKILNDDRPIKGSKKVGKKVFVGKVF